MQDSGTGWNTKAIYRAYDFIFCALNGFYTLPQVLVDYELWVAIYHLL